MIFIVVMFQVKPEWSDRWIDLVTPFTEQTRAPYHASAPFKVTTLIDNLPVSWSLAFLGAPPGVPGSAVVRAIIGSGTRVVNSGLRAEREQAVPAGEH